MQAFLGVCAAMIVMLFFTKALSQRRRRILIMLEVNAFLLLFFDRMAYIYHGHPGRDGYIMVRLCNLVVYFMTPAIIYVFNIYLFDLLKNECGMTRVPTRIRAAGILALIGMILAVVAHFTGLFYTFDDMNRYHRNQWFLLGYIIPLVAPLFQISVIYKYRRFFGKWIYISLMLFIISPISAAVIQIFTYGLSITNIVLTIVAMFIYIFAYLNINDEIEKAHKIEIEYLEDEKKSIRRLFDETVNSFVNALDGRYVHTQGHSHRVAQYSKKIAELDGKSEEECEEIYYAALLHDVGRIWMPDDIVKNLGNLSEEEKEKVMQMPVIGSQILSGINDMPNLDVGAHYHCERYDGKGYPDGLSGRDIPEAARIIAAADAYDLMASESDLTPPMPPQLIRDRFVQESGQWLDPKYAKIVMQVLDSKEMDITDEDATVAAVYENEFFCDDYREHVTAGIVIAGEPTKIRMTYESAKHKEDDFSLPSLIVFDSYDGRVHELPNEIEAYRYTEFGEVWFDGRFVSTCARNMTVDMRQRSSGTAGDSPVDYEITAYRQKDHIRMIIESEGSCEDVIIALPDSSRYAYIGLTGEHCHISSITIEKMETVTYPDIERIADPISYIERLESDIPNVQIDGKRTASTVGVPVKDGLRIDFHTMTLPSADLIWHCPYIVLFASDDGQVGGKNYTEYALIRLNGETRKTDEISQNVINVDKGADFVSWDKWKERNHKGYECQVNFRRLGGKITVTTVNAGISIENVTTIMENVKDVYAAITGDQCAITDIRIR